MTTINTSNVPGALAHAQLSKGNPVPLASPLDTMALVGGRLRLFSAENPERYVEEPEVSKLAVDPTEDWALA